MVDKVLAEAKKMYDDYTDNHPTIHCNRFLSWEELNDFEKNSWYQRASERLRKVKH